ncbi:MAG: 6,7-dimethyl-8-ribityllumazine synthase [Bacteroidota bacterium]|mgnify:CR=1 FL=1|nr:6,7-dimethyl-8-ribityllumazine synthase [Bacteroidota bacterium]MDX5404959.1 6,7-dimethyl-8-ribityllumazine synthase [Bacteroidota bacterium]MDX5427689.1 6,7-dimethyl-8-ribityllumazine synthase [Bacteroidota bacterium]MDX5449120.1 6,7-dimethyl-8-ribityllumazine synthase [Bacteroidota bacterium]MDX5505586.1 6,7-dimethyl-8-ribityllumazine synthase [Bacteroidota bacterium]
MATANKNLSEYDIQQMPKADHLRFGIVVSEWNEQVTEGLFRGAFETLLEVGVPESQIRRVNVPGSFELPFACKALLDTTNVDAVIAIGSVIQGETRHFDFVCQGLTQGISHLNVTHDRPVIFCVLTDNNLQQALDRSGGKHGNKGTEAAVAAVKMAVLRDTLK